MMVKFHCNPIHPEWFNWICECTAERQRTLFLVCFVRVQLCPLRDWERTIPLGEMGHLLEVLIISQLWGNLTDFLLSFTDVETNAEKCVNKPSSLLSTLLSRKFCVLMPHLEDAEGSCTWATVLLATARHLSSRDLKSEMPGVKRSLGLDELELVLWELLVVLCSRGTLESQYGLDWMGL